VNASGSTLPLSIFTGSGNDVVIGGQGDDIINSGRGDDIVFGRSGSDHIISVEGNQLDEDFDIIFGDDGIVKFKHFPREVTIDSRNAENQRLRAGDYRLSEVFSVDGGTAGDDVITSGNGDDILIGGFGADQLRSGDGSDILVGDSGRVVFELGNLSLIESTNSFDQSGTNDVLSGGDGVNYLIGGLGNDEILTGFTDGTEFSLILGDLGEISFSYNASTGINSVTGMASSFPGIGGDDKVSSSGSSAWIIAGSGMDQLVIPNGAFFTLGIGSFTPAFANDVLYHEWTILRSFEDSTGGRVINLDGYSLEQRTRLVDKHTGIFHEL
jgi:Ca2+-binding RTX toxin-like protein